MKIWECPADTRENRIANVLSGNCSGGVDWPIATSYGVNESITGSEVQGDSFRLKGNLKRLNNPSGNMLMCDTKAQENDPNPYNMLYAGYVVDRNMTFALTDVWLLGRLTLRHNGQVNFIFGDGHAKSRRRNQFSEVGLSLDF